jgi:hypothetical protein
MKKLLKGRAELIAQYKIRTMSFGLRTLFVCVFIAVLAAATSGREARARVTAAQTSCGAPSSIVANWVAAWKAKNFKQMVQLSEQSWRLRTSGAVGTLRAQYGFKDVLSYRFVRCSASNVSARVTFRVKYRTFKLDSVEITAMVIREDRSGNLSALGRWGVNPISTLREDSV